MSTAATAGQETVLIVDDVPQNLAVLHDTLDESGYRVLVSTGGEQALARAHEACPDIILLDAVMPGLDGFAVCKRLREHADTRDIPVIFMTGLTDSDDVVRGFAAGGNDYITKPVRPHEVLARLRAHLNQSARLRGTREAIDRVGRATLALDAQSWRLVWMTPEARSLIQAHWPTLFDADGCPQGLLSWLRGRGQTQEPNSLTHRHGSLALEFTWRGRASGGECLLALQAQRVNSPTPLLAQVLGLTPREAEVLWWATNGKTNRDIAEILQISIRTAEKHLQHVLDKLGLETRTAAAAAALRVVQSHQG